MDTYSTQKIDICTCGYEGEENEPPYLPVYTLACKDENGKYRYVIGRLICKNGESALYIAYDNLENKRVVIKEYFPAALCIRKEGTSDVKPNTENLALYKTYMLEFAELNHALSEIKGVNLRRVFSLFGENGTFYVVSEYVEGITLKCFLANAGGSIPWERAKDLFPPLLTALSQLHAAGIVHRGISPQNIVVTERGEIKLINFAISAAHTRGSAIEFLSYPGYSPPELYSGTGKQGAWTDVYGVCAILYHALTGQTPLPAQERERSEIPPPCLVNLDVPADASDTIMAGLALDREQRIRNINYLVECLWSNRKIPEHQKPRPIPEYQKNLPPLRQKNGSKSNSKNKNVKNNESKVKTNAIVIGLAALAFLLMLLIIISVVNPNWFAPRPITETTESRTASDTPSSETLPELTTDSSSGASTSSPDGMYVMPDLEGKRYELLTENPNMDFFVMKSVNEYSDTVEKGYIISQNVPTDTIIPYGTEVEVKVSRGPSGVKLPNYTGMFVDDYCALLSSLGIKYQKSPQEYGYLPEGSVLGCDVPNDSVIDITENGSTITVFYAVPPALPETPETYIIEMPPNPDLAAD